MKNCMNNNSEKFYAQIACYEAGTNRSAILGIFDVTLKEDIDISKISRQEWEEAVEEDKELIIDAVMRKWEISRNEIETTVVYM